MSSRGGTDRLAYSGRVRYLSTRDTDGSTEASFSEILLRGLAPDGGLYLPQAYPSVDAEQLASWRATWAEQGYAALGAQVLSLFIDDIPAEDLAELTHRAWNGEVFSTDQVVPVDQLEDGIWLAHLSEGPTAAFKDLAMQLLGQLFEYELARRDDRITIVGATSGDTGSAAEYAMLGRDRISVFMLTPAGRMSAFQRAQMFSLTDPKIHNLAIDGVFDDCQDLAKAVMNDAEFKAFHRIGAVNSINWARLVAQVVYYVAAWLQVTTADDQKVSFTVPTGNFGNICAGHVARQIGVPIDRLIVATNENDVLHEFFSTGAYRPRGADQTPATSSPSMDISKASNFERFIADLTGRDGARVAELFAGDGFDLAGTPEFDQLSQQYGFSSGRSSHADRIATIAELAHRTGVVIDPHTADGLLVARAQRDPQVPMIVLETALPVKFAETIEEALGETPELPDRFAGLLTAPQRVDERPADLERLKAYIRARA